MRLSLKKQVRLLSMVDVFEPLSPEELEDIGSRSPDVHLEEGQMFVAPWDVSERLFVLKRGRVQIYELTPGGEEITLSVVEGGICSGRWPSRASSSRAFTRVLSSRR